MTRLITLILLLFVSGCATEWDTKGSFFQRTQAEIDFKGTPQSKIFINNEMRGETPCAFGIDYEQEIIRKHRSVSYWHTHPGLTLFLSIVTIGIYLPFSAIPVDDELIMETTENYKNNLITVRYEKTGCSSASRPLTLGKDRKIILEMELLCTK
jgi:hypothetical protein